MEFLVRSRRRRGDEPVDDALVAPPVVAPGSRSAEPESGPILSWDAAVERWSSATAPQRGRGVVAVLVDHLADMEEDHGPTVTARLLLETEERLLSVVRQDDLVVRLDGRGHLVLAGELLSERDLHKLAERIHHAVRDERVSGIDTVDGRAAHWRITVSIGIAASFDRHPDLQSMGGRALAAARSSARHGGGHTVSAPSEADRPRSAWAAVQELHRAFEESELDVVFQPMVSLGSGRIEAIEALARWRHPERGLLHPATFLADLTRAGLDDRLTDLVIDRAAAQSAELGAAWGRRVPVAVNVDRTRRAPAALVKVLTGAANRHGIDLGSLVVELSEQRLTATDEGPSADGWPSLPLSLLVAAGVSVAVDGGSGDVASIGAMAPIRSLRWYKLDRRWLEPHRRAGLAAAAAMARSELGPTVPLAALGIGDTQRRETATDAGVDWGQGWALHRPVEAGQLSVDEISWAR
ncbi:MAG: GGDEF domain-containing phosphodiesterase [Actinomycetota bacterium]